MFTLRNYQKQAVDAVINDMKYDGNSLVVLPTGAGKSIVIAEVTNRINKPALILQPSKEILEQNLEKLRRYVSKIDTGIYSASFGLKQVRKFTFATIQSVYKKAELFRDFGLILFDEAHSYDPKNLDGMFATFLNGLDKPKVFGFTASPFRNYTRQFYEKAKNGIDTLMVAETRLKLINRIEPRFWNKIVFNINGAELIDKGYLCELKYYDLSFYRREELQLNSSGSDYDLEKFVTKLKRHEQKIIEYVARCAAHYKSVLVFCSTVEQAKLLASGMKDAECVDGKTKDSRREEIIEGFKAGKIKVVFNVGVLTTGFDHPELDCIMLLRPTRSLSLYYQMLGRGVRIADGKESCAVVDFTKTYKALGRIETIELVKEKTDLFQTYPAWNVRTETGIWNDFLVSTFKRKLKKKGKK
jgi:DNA repair protein RadD